MTTTQEVTLVKSVRSVDRTSFNIGGNNKFSPTGENKVTADTQMSTTGDSGIQSQILKCQPPWQGSKHSDAMFLTRQPYANQHTFCSHVVEDYGDCPRCKNECVREYKTSDAVICVWCFIAGKEPQQQWFCWRCKAPVSSEDDTHFNIWECSERAKQVDKMSQSGKFKMNFKTN